MDDLDPGAPGSRPPRSRGPVVVALSVITGLLLVGSLITTALALSYRDRGALALPTIFCCPLVIFGLPLFYLLRGQRSGR
jgi:hypothetical protein